MRNRRYVNPDNNRVETDVKREIREYLEWKHYEWQYFMPEKGNKHSKGVADMMVMKNGVTTFIETKLKGGVQDEWQKKFEDKCKRAGVEYILAFSIEDVKHLP